MVSLVNRSRVLVTLRKLARFAVVGFVGYSVDASLLTVIVLAGGDRYSGRIVSFLSSVLVTWALNRRYVFNDNSKRSNRLAELSRYVASSALGGGINLTTYWLLVGMVPMVHAHPWLGVAAGSLAGMTLNFLLYDRAVFVAPPPQPSPRPQ